MTVVLLMLIVPVVDGSYEPEVTPVITMVTPAPLVMSQPAQLTVPPEKFRFIAAKT